MIIWNADLGNAKREVAAFAAVASARIMTADDDGAIRAVKHRHSQVPFLPHGTSRNPSTLASIRSNLPDELLVGSRELQEELKDRLDNGGLFRTPRAIESRRSVVRWHSNCSRSSPSERVIRSHVFEIAWDNSSASIIVILLREELLPCELTLQNVDSRLQTRDVRIRKLLELRCNLLQYIERPIRRFDFSLRNVNRIDPASILPVVQQGHAVPKVGPRPAAVDQALVFRSQVRQTAEIGLDESGQIANPSSTSQSRSSPASNEHFSALSRL